MESAQGLLLRSPRSPLGPCKTTPNNPPQTALLHPAPRQWHSVILFPHFGAGKAACFACASTNTDSVIWNIPGKADAHEKIAGDVPDVSLANCARAVETLVKALQRCGYPMWQSWLTR